MHAGKGAESLSVAVILVAHVMLPKALFVTHLVH